MYRIQARQNGKKTTVLKAENLEILLKKAVNQRGLHLEAELKIQKRLGGKWQGLDQGLQLYKPESAA